MHHMTIHSRKLGREFHFTMNEGGGYVWLDRPNGDRKQICKGGGFMGSTIASRPEDFERDSRRWYRAHKEKTSWC